MAKSSGTGVLVLILGVLFAFFWIIAKISKKIEVTTQEKAQALAVSEIAKRKAEIDHHAMSQKTEIDNKAKTLNIVKQDVEEKIALLNSLINETESGFPYLAELYQDYVKKIGDAASNFLKYKKHPAYSASDTVSEFSANWMKAEKRAVELQAQIASGLHPENIKLMEKQLRVREDRIIEAERMLTQKTVNMEITISQAVNEKIDVEREAIQKTKEEQGRLQNALDAREMMMNNAFEEKTKGFPWLAMRYAEHIKLLGDVTAISLEKKSNPALKAAAEVREISRRAASAEKRAKISEGLVVYYESLFPWLEDLREAPDEVICAQADTSSTEDAASLLLTPGEWNNLSNSEKFQIALDRYCKRNMSNWEIGRRFERYVGYVYEQQGFDVVFFGALKGFEDLGRDLVATKGKLTKIIQCKYWAKDKTIHEKHLFQLYGTSIVYGLETNTKFKIQPIFITSCKLSDTARKVAKALNIEVQENTPLREYPLIKCNVGKNGERIYHLPFDQQYDKVKMEPHKGEFYAQTIKEAEKAGFRRAFRWRSTS